MAGPGPDGRPEGSPRARAFVLSGRPDDELEVAPVGHFPHAAPKAGQSGPREPPDSARAGACLFVQKQQVSRLVAPADRQHPISARPGRPATRPDARAPREWGAGSRSSPAGGIIDRSIDRAAANYVAGEQTDGRPERPRQAGRRAKQTMSSPFDACHLIGRSAEPIPRAAGGSFAHSKFISDGGRGTRAMSRARRPARLSVCLADKRVRARPPI